MNFTQYHKILTTETVSPIHADQVQIETLKLCFEHWNRLRNDRIAPAFSDIDLLAFPLKAIPASSIVDVSPDGEDLIYRFWGSSLTVIPNKDMTGMSVKSMPGEPNGSILCEQYKLVISSKKPALFTLKWRLNSDRKATETVLRLPISSDGEHIDHVLSFNDLGGNPLLFSNNNLYVLME